MSKTLDEIRRKLQALDTRKGGAGFGSGDKSTYAHWNIPEGTTCTLRFLQDANEDNTFPWAERQVIKLPFVGIKGQDEHKPITVQVPCIEMWDGKNSCPILNEVRPMWRGDAAMQELARKYWIKKTYYMQGFVKQDPLNEAEVPENPIRKFVIGPQLYAIIKAGLMDPDMTESPVDYINGTDFLVSKTSKGGYSDYGTSKWARKESSLTEDMMEAITKYGLVDLASYLPKKPTPEQLAVIFEMFQASIDGELYDPARFSQHYKPFGFDAGTHDEDGGEGKRATRSAPVQRSAPVAAPTPVKVPVVDDSEDDVPAAPAEKVAETVSSAPTATSGKTPQEILAMLRSRNK